MTEISDSRVLVTGAAQGMGRLMAEKFADRGASVALVDIDEEHLQETHEDFEARGFNVASFVCDLSERENIVQLRKDVLEQFGRVDILVNNAGVVAGGVYEDIDPELDQVTMDVNMGAVHWMTKEFLPDLKAGRDTHLVQMASAAGMIGVPLQAVYCGSKWFVIGLSEAIRQELKDAGQDHVGVSIICPSLVDTGMFEGADAPFLTPLLEPDFVADKVVEAVEDNKLYVREPAMVKLTPLMRALLPTSTVDLLMEKLGATALMKNFKGRH